ncbi:MAG TPA: CoA-binding protein [Thermoanaerobaculia bacterium]|nr:CoA-binding protein [Thermoanaerobaculia bacterium]
MDEWKNNLIERTPDILGMLRDTSSIAVLGMKPETHAGQAAHYVPVFMEEAGYEIIPVLTYYPDVTEVRGKPVFRKVSDIPKRVDMVNVFRRPADIDAHVDDIIAAAPKFVWFQLGIRNDPAARRLAEAGIKVVQDRCLMVEQGRL